MATVGMGGRWLDCWILGFVIDSRQASSITGFVSWPIFSISIVTVSPAFRNTGGLRATPTPCGVPVRITVPGSSVVLPLRNSISVRHVEDHVLGGPVLHRLAVEDRLDLQGVGIGNFVLRHQARARAGRTCRTSCRGTTGRRRILLPVAGGDVVAAGVAEHVVEGVLLGRRSCTSCR